MKPKQKLIYRKSAMQQYLQRREQDVLPRLISLPVVAWLWLVLILVLLVGLLIVNLLMAARLV